MKKYRIRVDSKKQFGVAPKCWVTLGGNSRQGWYLTDSEADAYCCSQTSAELIMMQLVRQNAVAHLVEALP